MMVPRHLEREARMEHGKLFSNLSSHCFFQCTLPPQTSVIYIDSRLSSVVSLMFFFFPSVAHVSVTSPGLILGERAST